MIYRQSSVLNICRINDIDFCRFRKVRLSDKVLSNFWFVRQSSVEFLVRSDKHLSNNWIINFCSFSIIDKVLSNFWFVRQSFVEFLVRSDKHLQLLLDFERYDYRQSSVEVLKFWIINFCSISKDTIIDKVLSKFWSSGSSTFVRFRKIRLSTKFCRIFWSSIEFFGSSTFARFRVQIFLLDFKTYNYRVLSCVPINCMIFFEINQNFTQKFDNHTRQRACLVFSCVQKKTIYSSLRTIP